MTNHEKYKQAFDCLTTDAEIDGFLQAFDTCYKTLTNKEN